jgi:hypothetical protein
VLLYSSIQIKQNGQRAPSASMNPVGMNPAGEGGALL